MTGKNALLIVGTMIMLITGHGDLLPGIHGTITNQWGKQAGPTTHGFGLSKVVVSTHQDGYAGKHGKQDAYYVRFDIPKNGFEYQVVTLTVDEFKVIS